MGTCFGRFIEATIFKDLPYHKIFSKNKEKPLENQEKKKLPKVEKKIEPGQVSFPVSSVTVAQYQAEYTLINLN